MYCVHYIQELFWVKVQYKYVQYTAYSGGFWYSTEELLLLRVRQLVAENV